MALDRRVQIVVRGPSTRDDMGRSVPGPVVTDVTVWAERQSIGASLDADQVSAVARTVVRWRVRWRADLAAAPDFGLWSLTADGTDRWAVLGVEESDERRRFLDVEAQRTDG